MASNIQLSPASVPPDAPGHGMTEDIAAAEAALLDAMRQGVAGAACSLARSLTQRFPERGMPWKILGALLWADGQVAEGLAAMQAAVRLLPGDAEAHCNLGLTLAKLNRYDEAETHLKDAIGIDPLFAAAHYRLGMTYSLQGKLEEAAACLRQGIALRNDYTEGDDAQNHSNLLFILGHDSGVSAAALFAEHCRYGQFAEGGLRASWPRHANDRDPERRLQVGFVSGDLYEHPVGTFLEPVLAHLQHQGGLELHAYRTQVVEDALSRRLEPLFRHWTAVQGMSDAALAARIGDDGIDLLIDLSGHTAYNRLPVFARKPAPLQLGWLGYPGTTGLGAVDYYLADEVWLPRREFAPLFTEKLAYLPDRWAFTPHPRAPAVEPLPALTAGRLTFGSFHRLGKINPATVQLWSHLLHAVPNATLLLAGMPGDGQGQRLVAQFAACGIDSRRLRLHGRCAMESYLALHNQVDIGLDTLAYAGATTTMHALCMGVPTLTVAGATSQSRAGAGILGKLGLDAFVAANPAQFIGQGRYWADHVRELAQLRGELRGRLAASPGGRPDFIAAHLQLALRHMWRRWCADLPAESFATATVTATPVAPPTGVFTSEQAATLNGACAKAMELQAAGQLVAAGQLYGAILKAAPEHAAANYGMGMLLVQSRRAVDSLPYLKAALQAQVGMSDYWLGYLEALTLAGRIEAARGILALGLQNGLAGPAVLEFATRLQSQQPVRTSGSAPATASAVAVAAPSGMGAETRKRPNPRRRGEQRQRLAQERKLSRLVAEQKSAAALALARRLTQRYPGHGFGWKILGVFMPTDAGFDAAIEAQQTAVRLLPEDPEALVNLGVTLAKAKNFAAAESCLNKALTLEPNMPAAHFRLGMTYELQGRNAEAEASLRQGRRYASRANTSAVDEELSYSHLLFLMSHNPDIDADELFAEHHRYGEFMAGRFRSSWPLHVNGRDPERCLKVGFVSGDLYEHSVSYFLEPVTAELRHSGGVELHAYATRDVHDAMNERLRTHFKRWHSVGDLSDPQLARHIAGDGIDILIDLSGHTGFNRLPVFARKPAPVQASWLGYPGTTGLSAMDYYLADRCWLPPARFARLFSEQLVLLPDRWAFKPHAGAPAVNPLPALATDRLTFGSFHRLGKINPPTIRLWSELLHAAPEATLLLVGIPVDGQERQLIERFAAHGIDFARLIFHGRGTMDIYLGLHHRVDIALDTLPYAGATTTMHSLSMGVPTLTLAGGTSQAHACAGILKQAGLDAFVAAHPADFVAKASYWAKHLHELADIRATLRARMNQAPGGQPALIATHLEIALRHMWRRWCAGLPAESFATADLAANPPSRVNAGMPAAAQSTARTMT